MSEFPGERGYYFATHRKWGWRCCVLVDTNGVGHLRVFSARFSSCSFGIEEFTDYDGPLVDPHPLPIQKKDKK